MAKEAGLNGQGFVFEVLANSSLPLKMKERLGNLLMQDPFASPMVKQLQTQVQQLTGELQKAQQREAILRTMASQRLERQAEWVAAQKEIKRNEIALKQWQQENKDTQEARMELLRTMLQQGNTVGALALLDSIKQVDPPIVTDPVLNAMGNQDLAENTDSIREDINNAGTVQQPAANPGQPGTPIQQQQQNVVRLPTSNPARPGPSW